MCLLCFVMVFVDDKLKADIRSYESWLLVVAEVKGMANDSVLQQSS